MTSKTEQNVLYFQSHPFKHLGSIYLLNIIVLRNVEEAEKNWRPGISYSNPIPVLIPVCEIANSGMGRELKKSIPTIREREGNEKNPFPQFGNGKGKKKTHSHNLGKGRE